VQFYRVFIDNDRLVNVLNVYKKIILVVFFDGAIEKLFFLSFVRFILHAEFVEGVFALVDLRNQILLSVIVACEFSLDGVEFFGELFSFVLLNLEYVLTVDKLLFLVGLDDLTLALPDLHLLRQLCSDCLQLLHLVHNLLVGVAQLFQLCFLNF